MTLSCISKPPILFIARVASDVSQKGAAAGELREWGREEGGAIAGDLGEREGREVGGAAAHMRSPVPAAGVVV